VDFRERGRGREEPLLEGEGQEWRSWSGRKEWWGGLGKRGGKRRGRRRGKTGEGEGRERGRGRKRKGRRAPLYQPRKPESTGWLTGGN
jgi:hypothetical protein